MTTQLRVAILCSLTIMLSSCSSKHGSKEEAYNAQREFINNGEEIVIIDAPTDIEVQKERTRIAAVRKFSCPAVKQIIDDGVTYKLQEKRAYIENECYEGAPVKVSKETMTKREVLNTRDCFLKKRPLSLSARIGREVVMRWRKRNGLRSNLYIHTSGIDPT